MEVNIMTILKPKDVADRLGITTRTLQTWDRKGILKAKRSPTNRRFYTEDQINQYLSKNSLSSNKKSCLCQSINFWSKR